MALYDDEFYVTLPSNASVKVFEDNKPSNFTIQLPHYVQLQGEWGVAAMEFQFTNDFEFIHDNELHSFDSTSKNHPRSQAVFIYSDIADYQFVGDVKAQLLGVVPIVSSRGDRQHWTFSPPYYSRVATTYFNRIKVWIADQCGDEIKFADTREFVLLRLHFQKKQQRL